MMLHFHHRKSQFFRDHHRIVPLDAYHSIQSPVLLPAVFPSFLQSPEVLLPSQIFQISDIWRRIKSVIHTNAKRILEFSTNGKHLSSIWCGNHKRKRCIPSGTSDHIWSVLIKSPLPNRPHGYGSCGHGTACSRRIRTILPLLPDHHDRLAHQKYFHWSLPEIPAFQFHHHM